MHSEICPICHGTGRVEVMPSPDASDASLMEQTCHGCSGVGWVAVPDEVESDTPDRPVAWVATPQEPPPRIPILGWTDGATGI